jgi:hypothetical protein
VLTAPGTVLRRSSGGGGMIGGNAGRSQITFTEEALLSATAAGTQRFSSNANPTRGSRPMIHRPTSANGDHHSGQNNTQARFTSSTAGPSAAGSSGVGGVHGKRKADTAAETGMLGRSRLPNSSALADASSSQHRGVIISQRAPLMLPNPHKTMTAGGSNRRQMAHPAYLV